MNMDQKQYEIMGKTCEDGMAQEHFPIPYIKHQQCLKLFKFLPFFVLAKLAEKDGSSNQK